MEQNARSPREGQSSPAAEPSWEPIRAESSAQVKPEILVGEEPRGAQEPASAEATVRPVQFEALTVTQPTADRSNIELLLDVKLPVTVELGRTDIEVRQILEFGPGSIVELGKEVNAPVDLLVNGVLMARGEVVVVEDHFGVRLTSLISPEERIRCLGAAA